MQSVTQTDGVIVSLPVDKVYPNPAQPRKQFDEAYIAELAASIRENGQQQPGIVWPDAQGRYLIVAGECRWRACQQAGVAYQAVIRADLSADQIADIAILENYQRRDITPLEEAHAFQARLDSGLSIEALAKRIGIKRPTYIRNRLALLNLQACYQKLVHDSGLTIGQAQQMARLSAGGQDALFQMISKGQLKTFKEVTQAADGLLAAEQQTGLFALDEVAETPAAKRAVRSLESRIEAVEALLRKTFKQGEIVIQKHIPAHQAAAMAEKIQLIVKHLNWLNTALRKQAIHADVGQALLH